MLTSGQPLKCLSMHDSIQPPHQTCRSFAQKKSKIKHSFNLLFSIPQITTKRSSLPSLLRDTAPQLVRLRVDCHRLPINSSLLFYTGSSSTALSVCFRSLIDGLSIDLWNFRAPDVPIFRCPWYVVSPNFIRSGWPRLGRFYLFARCRVLLLRLLSTGLCRL